MKYAVLKIAGKQYKVTEGEELLVNKINDTKVASEVLLVVDGEKVHLGKPLVEGAKVVLKLETPEVKGEKLYISKYKAKSRYRRRTGFRQVYSKIKVDSIKV